MRIGVEPFDVSYGASFTPEDVAAAAVECPLVEDGGTFTVHAPVPSGPPAGGLAFVDGVMRTDARLTRTEDDGTITPGLAGSWAAGAAVVGEGRVQVEYVTSGRLVVFAGGVATELPSVDGWSWEPQATESDEPDAGRILLQRAMRDAEGLLGDRLSSDGLLTVLDGPLNNVRLRRTVPLVGYVKTHRRPMLEPLLWARVPELSVGERCSMFAIGEDRYGCYLRVGDAGPWSGPWAGIVRLEVPAGVGRDEAMVVLDDTAGWLPRFASVPHRDPRAPVNLAPIAGLEHQLRRQLGDAGLASRAVRKAVLQMETEI